MLSFCSYYNQAICRSCEWLERDYASQIQTKEQTIREALSFFPDTPLAPSVLSPLQGFRNRAKMFVTGSVDAPVVGLLGESDLDHGRELLACPIHHPKLNQLIRAMPTLIREFQLTPYRIKERKGECKGLIAFYSPRTDQMYLRFILRSKACVSGIEKLLPVLQNQFPELICVSVNIQPIPHAILEGPEEIYLTKNAFIDHQIGAIRLKLAPRAFVQTHSEMAGQLYQTAANWIRDARPTKVLDLFCGQGAFSFFAAGSAPEILGIEINSDAVNIANLSAREQGFQHLTFKALDAAKISNELAAFKSDLILANPPRRGLGESLVLIQKQLPKHLLYSSCSIQTLALDLKSLSRDFTLKRVQLFDMFPHTMHFETLVWLSRSH
ncbi:methyltransferase domain-containing protein [Bdellovibrionota bacterium FG-2]